MPEPKDLNTLREKIEETVAQWIDSHPDCDSGTEDAQDALTEIGDELEDTLRNLFNHGDIRQR